MHDQDPINVTFSPPLKARLDLYFTELGLGLNAGALCRERQDILLWLNAKSEAELALMGLSRKDIPAFVFADLFGNPPRN